MIKELINFLIQHNMVATIFYKILYMSIIGSLVGITIFLIRKAFDKKISPKWKCIMWMVFIFSLLIPFRFEIKTNLKYENKFINNLDTIPQIAESRPQEEIVQNSQDLAQSNLIVSEMLEPIEETEAIQAEAVESIYSLKDIFLLIVIPYVWLGLMITLILSFTIGYLKINKQIKNNKCNDIVVNGILKECLNSLNIKKNIKLYYQNYKKSTSIFGIFNSKILISKEVLKLDDDSLKYIFMHELAHFKRKDLILNMIMLLIVSIHFFNPVVWYIFKKIREDIELAADEYVVKNMNKNQIKQYGLTLIHMLELSQTNNYAINFLCMSDTEKNMERRIKMIKNPLKNKVFSAIFVILVIAIIASIVFIKSTGKENMMLPVEDGINKLSTNYEHLWTEPKERTSYEEYLESINVPDEYKKLNEAPEEYKNPTVSEEEKQNLISEEEAKKIGKEIIDKIGYTKEEIKSIKLSKNIISAVKYSYEMQTTSGILVYIDAENGDFSYFRYDNLIKERFENEKLSDEDLKTFTLNLYKTFDFLNQDYEFYKCTSNITAMGVGDVNSSNYKQYTKEEYNATFYERRPTGVLNKYKYVSIGFYVVDGKALISGITSTDEIKAKQGYYSKEEYIDSDNKVELTEAMAIKIAQEKDASISKDKEIKKVRTELITNLTNFDVWAWEKGFDYDDLKMSHTEGGEDGTIETSTSFPKYYYDKYYLRNTYEVVIIYDVKENDPYYGGAYNGWLGRVYYIDATTGEILGGRELSSFSDIETENDYLFDEEDNYTAYKTTYYDSKTREVIYEKYYDLPDEMKAQFYIKKDEKPNTVSYNIY